MAKVGKYALIFFLFSFSTTKVTPTYHAKLEWLNMDELGLKLKENPKPVLIDLYTNWCSWCKEMDNETYRNPEVVSYINDHFYPVKLDAESKDVVQWKARTFKFNPGYNLNEFALYVTSGDPGFPTTVIIPDQKSEPQAVPGFLNPNELEPVLKYFGEGAYKTESYSEFKSNFKASW
jgi:thioredoxin-related protein